MNNNIEKYDVAIIGAGASGLMASVGLRSAESDIKIVIIDKNEKIGKKMYITGKGRCNVCNKSSIQNIIENTVHNARLLYKSLQVFSPDDVISFFENNGCKLKVERGNRVFPFSDKSSDIIKVFSKFIQKNNIDLILNCDIKFIEKQNNVFKIYSENNCITANHLIIATGGMSYPATGSNGSGYRFAKNFNHSIIAVKSALCGFKVNEIDELQGLTLKNIKLTIKVNEKQKFSEIGDITFYKNLISGPLCLTASSLLNDYNLSSLIDDKLCVYDIDIDLKANVDEEEFKTRFYKEFDKSVDLCIGEFLCKFMPLKMAQYFANTLNLKMKNSAKNLKKDDLKQIFYKIRKLSFKSNGLDDIKNGIITSGGVNVKEINPVNMQSKIVTNLYFVGEVLDLDAFTGGYNMQIAFSTGYTCGKWIVDNYLQSKTMEINYKGE